MGRCALAGIEEAHHWGTLGNIIEYLYTTRACPIMIQLHGFKLLSAFAKVLSHVSKPFINFLGAKSRLWIENFIDTGVVEWRNKIPTIIADTIDLIAGSKAKLTDPTLLGSSDHNQLHFNINIKSDKTKVKQCRGILGKVTIRKLRKV